MKTFGVLATACVLYSVFLDERVSAASTTANVSALADVIIASIQSDASSYNLNPFSVNDIEDKTKVLFVTFSLDLDNGEIYGADTVFRNGDVTLTTDDDTDEATLNLNIGFTKLNYSTDYVAKMSLIKSSGKASGIVTDLYANMIILANTTNSSAVTCTLQSLTITDKGTFSVHIDTGNSITEFFANLIAKTVLKLFKNHVVHFMETNFAGILNNTFSETSYDL